MGGESQDNKVNDSIRILNLDSENDGWKELNHIKYPIPSAYASIVTADNYVHLLTKYNKPERGKSIKAHYPLPLSVY